MLRARFSEMSCRASPRRGTADAMRTRFYESMNCPTRRQISTHSTRSGHQLVEKLGIAIAAGQHRHDDLALDVELSSQQCRQPNGPARLDHELQFAEGKRHRLTDLLVAGGDPLAHQPPV